jgi:hypothetical protein
MILIGSRAIKHWFPDFKRDPKDWDYIIFEGEKVLKSNEIRIENLINPVFTGYEYPIILPNDLYTLKMSHMFWDINWDKHMFDIQFLKDKGCKINIELFHKLYEFWNSYHSKNRRSDLVMNAEDFFDNALKCEYDHDFIHTLLNPYPTFNKVLKDGAEVEVDENKFHLLSYEEKCDLVYEEVMVMAWERWPKLDYRRAYSKMLKKFIINHAPIWEAIFIIENFKELHKPKFNYFKKIEDELK